MKWQRRVELLRKAADLVDQRIYEFGAITSLEVGKNRMEALGDAAEMADLIRYSCDRMEAADGYVVEMGKDPLSGYRSTQHIPAQAVRRVAGDQPVQLPLRPFGRPAGAALVTGNTLVLKPATDTPWTPRLIAECCRDAGLPDGVCNYVTAPAAPWVRRSSSTRTWPG